MTQTITDKQTFQIAGWDQVDSVRKDAEKLGLFVHTDFPGITYTGDTLTLGLVDFPSAHTHNSYPTAIVNEIELAEVNTTSRVASLLLLYKEQIPESWRQYDLILPGTTWISPNNVRGLTRMHFSEDEGGWHASFQAIESFPVFKGCRFVADCREIAFPERVGNLR